MTSIKLFKKDTRVDKFCKKLKIFIPDVLKIKYFSNTILKCIIINSFVFYDLCTYTDKTGILPMNLRFHRLLLVTVRNFKLVNEKKYFDKIRNKKKTSSANI